LRPIKLHFFQFFAKTTEILSIFWRFQFLESGQVYIKRPKTKSDSAPGGETSGGFG